MRRKIETRKNENGECGWIHSTPIAEGSG